MEEPDPGINGQIDAVFRIKNRGYLDSYVPPMISPDAHDDDQARAARDDVMPVGTGKETR